MFFRRRLSCGLFSNQTFTDLFRSAGDLVMLDSLAKAGEKSLFAGAKIVYAYEVEQGD